MKDRWPTLTSLKKKENKLKLRKKPTNERWSIVITKSSNRELLRKVILDTKVKKHGKLAAKYEGSYVITKVCRPKIYYLRNADDLELMRP